MESKKQKRKKKQPNKRRSYIENIQNKRSLSGKVYICGYYVVLYGLFCVFIRLRARNPILFIIYDARCYSKCR